MLKRLPGDIILVRGRSLRYKLTRFVLRCEWNHAVVYYKDNQVQELNWHGTQRKSFDVYRNKHIVVLRLQPLDPLVSRERDAALLNALDKLQEMNFDWVEYVRRCLHLKPKNRLDKSVCDAYINSVYREAGFKVDCTDLMRKEYGSRKLLLKHNLIKVYDYRDHLLDAQ